jgi:asparagine N-glycosylation enzyme membrane subunit Stt3
LVGRSHLGKAEDL